MKGFQKYIEAINTGNAALVKENFNPETGKEVRVYRIGNDVVLYSDYIEGDKIFIDTLRKLNEDEVRQALACSSENLPDLVAKL